MEKAAANRFGGISPQRLSPRLLRLPAHPWAAVLAWFILLPFGYLIYCIATLPFSAGMQVEPTPSALVVAAQGGQVFATRGVFKGEKLEPQDASRQI